MSSLPAHTPRYIPVVDISHEQDSTTFASSKRYCCEAAASNSVIAPRNLPDQASPERGDCLFVRVGGCEGGTLVGLLRVQSNLQSTDGVRPQSEWPSNCSPPRTYIHPEPLPCSQPTRSLSPPPSTPSHLPTSRIPDTHESDHLRCLPPLHPRPPRPPRAPPSSVSLTARRLLHTTLISRRSSRSPPRPSPSHPGLLASPQKRRRTRSTTSLVLRAPRARADLATRA